MEPEGDLLIPGTSYGPPASDTAKNSAANTFVSHTLQASYSPTPRDELLPVCGEPWAVDAEGAAFERIDGPLSREDSGRSAQRTFRPSAFPSSLAWDSDSEKETIDEEELQHFSNPHGLAAHSPGSPSSGLRLDRGEAQTPEKLQPLISEKEKTKPLEGEPTGSPLREEPKISSAQHLSLTGKAHEQIWNASLKEEPFQSKVKPKEGHQIEKEEKDEIEMGEKTQKGKDIKGPERDVYTFPADSDPESPSPPAPWPHPAFTQRRRKKRALLRPFSNVGTWQSSSPGALRRARGGPQRSKGAKSAQLRGSRPVYDFAEDLGKECAEEEEVRVQEEKEEKKKGGGGGGGEELAEEDMSKEIYTCVECSIYFKKQDHLQEHMAEHYQSGGSGAAGRRGRLAKGCRFRCLECGWNLPNRLALTDHRRRHQESRRRILEEIGKLSDGGKGDGEMRNVESSVPEAATSSLVVVPEPNQAPEPDSASVSASDPVPAPEPEQAPLPVPGRLRGRATGGNRRQFVCSKCDFATRTSQALANHAKTHNRPPKVGAQRFSPRLRQRRPPVEPGYPSTLTCDLCVFLASSQSMLREHRSLAHPERASVSGVGHEGVMGNPGTSSGNLYSIRSIPDPDELSGHESTAAPRAVPESQHQPGTTVVDGSSQGLQFPVPHTRELAFKCIGNRRVNKRGQGWTGDASLCPRLDSNREEIENEYADCLRGNSNLATELNEEKTDSTAGFKPRTTTRSRLDCTSTHQSPTLLGNPGEKRVKEEEEEELEEAAKLSPVKKNVSIAANKNSDSNENDYDEEEQIRHLLAKGILEEDEDEIDEETGTCVERKCPYCPDRFHNGIGLANHVRGHLNRVGVSYNVRHFISPEEVNAIEKKFSYQKKKKKVANFDPDTFSVMRCEFCSAGFDTRAGLSSHARAHLRDFGITNWEVTVSPIHILRELFSSRPDLVIPTAPPRSPGSQPEDEDEDEDEEGEEGDINDLDEEGGNLGTAGEPSGERKERETSAKFSNLMSSTSPQPWKTEHCVEERGGGEEDGEEDDDEAEQQRMPADLDSLSSSPGKKGLLSPDTENPCPRVEANAKGPNLLRCEVGGARFETRRGLSSHARSHLRQLGIGVSESSGAPIDLLYQISKERSLDGHLPPALSQSPSAKKPPHAPPASHNNGPFEEDMDYEEKPVVPVSGLAKAVKVCSSASTPSPAASPPPSTLTGSSSTSPSPVVKKAPISSLLPVSSPLRSLDHKPGGMKSLSSSFSAAAAVSPSSAPSTTTTTTTSSMSKPFWAPQETDAPLNLTLEVDPNKDIICQLCGAWFETRKGLSSHARAHLRHFGVEYSESKGSPIDLLNQLIHTDDFKHRASALQPAGASDVRSLTPGVSSHKRSIFTTSSSSPLLYKVTTVGGSGAVATSSSVSLLGPAPKRSKSSTMQVFRLSTGELMSMPHSEPTKEIGCEFCGEYFENRKGLSSHARSHLRQMGITEWSVNGSPIDTLREIITRRGLRCTLPLRTLKTPPSSSPGPPRSPLSSSSSPSSASLQGRLPFAFARPSSPQTPVRKMGSGSRSSSTGLVLKLKPEPVQLEVTMPGTVGGSGTYNAESLNCSWSSSDSVFPLNLAMAQEVEPTRDIRCEFCGEYFENRKGLSSHARSHLRQMGITEWSVNGSPIDTLREIMHKRGTTSSSSSSPAQGVKKESSPTWEGLGGLGGLGSLASLGFQSPKFSRKSPLNLLHSGSRLHKHGLGAVGLSATPPPGKFFGVSALGKRPLSEDSCPLESARSPPPPQPKTFSPLPHDFSFKGKSSPDKHGGGHQDASCELCGFYFENRKALASHARAHLRQFGVTEWCVNGSPIETLSAWMRSRPHKVVEMHRSYMQGSHSTPKKKSSSPRSPPSDSDHAPSHRTPSSQWSALGLNQARPVGREVTLGSPKVAEGESSSGPVAPYSSRPSHGGPAPSHARHVNHSTLLPHAQVARSELNVRLPRGFERRPLKHPSHPEGVERESGPAKPPRTGTIPALVPKPPSTPLVKLVGKFYTLKCRFCEVEFHGPLSVQEDWIRHLQQHILQLNYSKPSTATAIDSSAQPEKTNKHPEPASASASTLSTTTPTAPSTTQRTPSPPPVKNAPILQPSSSPPPTPPTGSDATVTATPTAPASTQPLVSPSPVPIAVPSQAL